jgi:hypothetical protein
MADAKTIDGWAVLELMGHRRMAGRVTEALVGGTTLLRIDIPRNDGSTVTQFYGVGSVYCITPTTEEVARAVALANPPEPVHPWELRAALPAAPDTVDAEEVEQCEYYATLPGTDTIDGSQRCLDEAGHEGPHRYPATEEQPQP